MSSLKPNLPPRQQPRCQKNASETDAKETTSSNTTELTRMPISLANYISHNVNMNVVGIDITEFSKDDFRRTCNKLGMPNRSSSRECRSYSQILLPTLPICLLWVTSTLNTPRPSFEILATHWPRIRRADSMYSGQHKITPTCTRSWL